ncbi:hypothetical protein BDF20DRAFT_888804 [Mycotypha africana]|uniref:uncharacterized protein n=1 Tax=Mycotypha africana TaxID=64632 RepID=UPI002300EC7A|nr:uncharacterized protein BDF20DRAFT_888804 [Mycotypha africana]KAI8969995.1 hypothetical protein BDF20DRAFT_888804 [Mycotypha africana]
MQDDTIVLHYHDVVIRQSDLETLTPGQWLNDTMIEFYMEFLERTFVPKDANYLFLRPGMVHLVTYAEGDVQQLLPALPPKLHDYEAIFMPINDGRPDEAYSGTHWSIMVYIKAANAFYYYDTLKFNNLRHGDLACKRFKSLLRLRKPAQFIPSSTPQQENNSDCGVCIIAILEHTLHQLLKSRGKKQEDIQYNKIMMLKEKNLSTPKQVRDNINGMIKRLQQRLTPKVALSSSSSLSSMSTLPSSSSNVTSSSSASS